MLARTDDQIVDLVRAGQGVLNIVPLGPVVERPRRPSCTVRAAARAAAVRRAPVEHGRAVGARAIDAEQLPHETVRFAHNSERQFAKLLDFYGIAWEYEPRTFTLECDRDGNPAQAFTPDFYLPAYDLYIEITTLNQKLVTKKNRKARRLRELHPEVQIRVLYQRDYLHLLVKYGLEPPSQLVDAGAPGDGAAAASRPRRRRRAAEPPGHRRPSRRDRAAAHQPARRASTARSAPRMVPFGGWEMPIQYARRARGAPRVPRTTRSCSTSRTSARSSAPAPDAFALLQWLLTNDLGRIEPGRAQYTHLLDPDDAHVVDDIIVWWVGTGALLRDAERVEHRPARRRARDAA